MVLRADPEEVEKFLRDVPEDGAEDGEAAPAEGTSGTDGEREKTPDREKSPQAVQSGHGAEGGGWTDWVLTCPMSGERSTPLGGMLGFTIPAAQGCLICDEQFINWPLPDRTFKVTYFTGPWLMLGEQVRSGQVPVCTELVVVAAAAGEEGKVAKNTVFTWIQDVVQGLKQVCSQDTQIFFATMLPRAPPHHMECINLNRNMANGIRRWNRVNPLRYVKYVGWHKVVLEESIPADGIWERHACDLLRQELLRVTRLM